jgi:hypothetical protein
MAVVVTAEQTVTHANHIPEQSKVLLKIAKIDI